MPRKKKVLVIDVQKLINEFFDRPNYCSDYTVIAQNGMLEDGRNYQIQLKITVDEDDFIEESEFTTPIV